MTRLAVTLDRVAALIAGIFLIVLGAAVVVWNTTWLPDFPSTLTMPAVHQATAAGWWPWAVAGVGLVLVVLALRWLLAHTPAAKVTTLPLQTNDAGSITIDLGHVANAAAQTLEQSLDVESASGTAIIDRGTRTVEFTVTMRADARARQITSAIDAACAQVGTMLGDPSIAVRTTIRAGKREDVRRVR